MQNILEEKGFGARSSARRSVVVRWNTSAMRLAGIEFHSDGLAGFLVNHDRLSVACRMLRTTSLD